MPTTTAAQRRKAAREEFEVFFEDCPSRLVLSRLADKWVAIILLNLGDGPLRHSELARAIATVSQKMLTQNLRNLERDGLVTRSVEPTVPVTVTYALTDLGRGMLGILDEIVEWGAANVPLVEQSHREYDEANPQ